MKTLLLLASLCMVAGCGNEASGPEPSTSNETVIAVDAGGRITQDGKTATLAELSIPAGDGSLEYPVVIKADPDLRMGDLAPLLRKVMIRTATITLLLEAKNIRLREVLPTMLSITRGPVQHGSKRLWPHKDWEKKRLWIHVRVGKGGQLLVRELSYGLHSALWETPIEIAPDGTPKSQGEVVEPWKGEHPPLGIWKREKLRDFAKGEATRKHSPYIRLEIHREDLVWDVISALGYVREAVDQAYEAELLLGNQPSSND